MESFTNDPASARPPQSAPAWAGQPSPMGPPQSAPAWAGQPSPMGPPQSAPAWAGQPSPMGPPQSAPAWAGQSDMSKLNRKPEWPALRFVAKYLKVVAWIELVVGVISSLSIAGSLIAAGSGFLGFGVLLVALVVTALWFMLTFASSEAILVFLAIEKNTRKDE